MNRTFRVTVLSTLFILTILQLAQAQTQGRVEYVPDKEAGFRDALAKYVARDYRAAFVRFEDLSNARILHHRATATLLMTGKSLYKLRHYQDALPYFRRLISTFPQSDYLDDAYYARAAANYRLNNHSAAVSDLFWVLENSAEKKLLNKSVGLAGQIMRSSLSTSDLTTLLNQTNHDIASAIVTIELAQRELGQGSAANARAILNRFKRKFPGSVYRSRVDELIAEAKDAGNRPFKVGVVLPLSGYFSDEGKGVLSGIRFAHETDQSGARQPVQLVVRDSGGSMIKAIQSTRELLNREHVGAIIGDLESATTAAVGALAANKNVPVVGPTATENGVASVGATVYQLNSDLEGKGRALAEYAIRVLGLHTFGTLAPSDNYGRQMIDSFSATVDELGGRIIAQSWYLGTPEDLSRQFKVMRESAFLHDSTDVEAMIQEATEAGRDLEERDIPVTSIDAFFIPVYSEDLKYVAPQLALHNIQTQILGGEYLDDLNTLTQKQIQRYINGAIFVSDYFPGDDSPQFRRFRTAFRLSAKRTPERWEVFGFDAYQIISDAINAGAGTGREVSDRLKQLRDYRGKKGTISFQGNNRVNREVNILQFINGTIVKHEG